MTSVTKIIEVVGRSSIILDDAVKSALAEKSRTLRNVKALDVVSIGQRGDDLDEWVRWCGSHSQRRTSPTERQRSMAGPDSILEGAAGVHQPR